VAARFGHAFGRGVAERASLMPGNAPLGSPAEAVPIVRDKGLMSLEEAFIRRDERNIPGGMFRIIPDQDRNIPRNERSSPGEARLIPGHESIRSRG
jgi:hypothetical protein